MALPAAPLRQTRTKNGQTRRIEHEMGWWDSRVADTEAHGVQRGRDGGYARNALSNTAPWRGVEHMVRSASGH